MSTFSDNLKAIRLERKMSQEEFAKLLGTSKQVISRYETGQRNPKISVAKEYAEILGVTLDQLTGSSAQESSFPLPANIVPVKRVRIPLLGGIAAGEPIAAEQDFDSYVDADEDVHCDYALRIDGDSMTPTVQLGDLVFIRQQEDVDDGQIAAVLIDEGATLKRVRHIPNGLLLMSDNPKYEPMVFTFPDCDTIRILGKAVAFKRML